MTFDVYFDVLSRTADPDEWEAALAGIVEQAQRAEPAEVQTALERLAQGMRAMPFFFAQDLAQVVGAVAGLGTDPLVVLPVLVERATEVLESAALFAGLCEADLGEIPDLTDESTAREALARFTELARRRSLDAHEAELLMQAWMSADQLVQPLLVLCQRADARAALPGRERLAAAIEPVRERLGTPSWLAGLLEVLDDEPLIVLDRGFAGTGRGYRVTIGGIADNFQLHTLLAAALISDPADETRLPGRPPTEIEIAAASTGDPAPDGGITGSWNMIDANGDWIWNEGKPADIPHHDGVRVIVLDAAPYERSWNAGRVYPLMLPTLRVDGPLTPQEAAALLSQVKPASR
ncbi:hypothetical protein GCM10010435_79490 [Winogradskya consettensis]|uniref:Uncharacterized protein n=1 Tax=Winogradskya consettensis TaxID=113560 RepID=A0A919SUV5_9ACTN|nr:hypothetical protein [Actinoplanes consettensis]GIM77463.1 hypothetical protein Aco04nite_55470 [Actinoplanes consettensis]